MHAWVRGRLAFLSHGPSAMIRAVWSAQGAAPRLSATARTFARDAAAPGCRATKSPTKRLLSRGGSFVGVVPSPRAGRRSPVRYVWRSRQGILRASRTDGSGERGRPRPEIFHAPRALGLSQEGLFLSLPDLRTRDGYAFPFVRTIAMRTGLSKTTVEHAIR